MKKKKAKHALEGFTRGKKEIFICEKFLFYIVSIDVRKIKAAS